MKFVTLAHDAHVTPGLLFEQAVLDLPRAAEIAGKALPDTLLGLIEAGPDAIAIATELAKGRDRWASALLPLDAVRLLAPIPRPRRNIFCVGRNYLDHVREGFETIGAPVDLPEAPQFFTKATTAVIGPEGAIRLDPQVTRRLDYEIELAVIIGKSGRDIRAEEATNHIFGYSVCNDVSARDLQKRHDQWFKGKSLDGSFPFGPCIVDATEIGDPTSLELSLHINGEERQRATVSQMIFDIPTIIASLSAGMTLEAGDVIATGTPSGVGFAMNPRQWLRHGDVVSGEISRIGRIENRVVDVSIDDSDTGNRGG